MGTDTLGRSDRRDGTAPAFAASPGAPIDVLDLSVHAGDVALLHDISLSIRPGELVALVGGSGAGKTTLLDTMAGLRRATSGTVTYRAHAAGLPAGDIGYVPQDDIIHRALPLRRTLRYAARLRLPATTTADEVDRVVDQVLSDLELADRGEVTVGQLSGGQRKRASIAVELLTRPQVFFLDEPTSGLDPATSAEVLRVVRRLADRGMTVVLTTHDPAEIDVCDRVVFLARNGHLAFAGTPDDARRYFEVTNLVHAYQQLAHEDTPELWAARFAASRGAEPAERAPDAAGPSAVAGRRLSLLRQCALLSRRNADILVRSRLTLAVLIGSPVLVISMMAVLFAPGGFERIGPGSVGPVQTVFWVAFAGFFFGLTYGLLQIVGEVSVFRRERFAGLSVVAYLSSKVVVLLPVLASVNLTMLAVLRALDRLPAAGMGTYALLFVTLMVESLCALALGLLTSAAVADAAQATLALPMLCFPQVLFAGAVVPVAQMSGVGRVMSSGMANRWAFEALGRGLHIDGLDGRSAAITAYSDAFAGSVLSACIVLAVLGLLFTVCATGVLAVRTRRAG
ncbi:MAG: ATP-binding cassette domain-containing protein [Acidimicrobiales bacterium]